MRTRHEARLTCFGLFEPIKVGDAVGKLSKPYAVTVKGEFIAVAPGERASPKVASAAKTGQENRT